MDKRSTKRVKIHQLAKIDGKVCVIKDISDTGLHVSTAILPKKRKIDIYLDVEGQELMVMGVVQWFRRKNSLHSLNELGVVVEKATNQYHSFVNRLSASTN